MRKATVQVFLQIPKFTIKLKLFEGTEELFNIKFQVKAMNALNLVIVTNN